MVHLHVHSHYSLLDGITQVSDLVKKAKELEMPAIALTEHGNINSWVTFQRECKAQNIKPIFGMEAYCCTDTSSKETYHITLLAKNNDGLREIIQLHNKAALEQFYRKPRITYDQILQCKNIVVLSGCMGSYLSQKLLKHDYPAADKWVNAFHEHFKNDFYIEIQDLGMPELDSLRERTKRYTDRAKRVITNDVHYLTEQDAEAHHLFMAGQFHKKASDMKRTPPTMWLKPDIKGIDSKTTYEIAEKCNASIEIFPNTLPTTNLKVSDFLMPERILDREQLRKEYDIISSAGFMSYICIVADYVHWARKQNIEIGTLRGSVGGSRLAYAMGIHDINPDDYGLYFSRFYNEGRRGSMPDIDTDFPQGGIEQIKKYLQSKYNIVGMATYGSMNIRGAIKFAGRVLDIPFQKMNEFSQKFGEYEIEDIPLGNLAEDMQECLEYAKKYIGLFDKFGQHASGYVLTDINIHNNIPLRRSKEGEIQATWDMVDLESLGFVKFDLLKIKTLDIIQDAKRLANTEIIPNDKKTYKLISSGNNLGIFQISGSDGISALAKEIKPRSLEDIGLILALYRPGPLSNNAHIEYVACRNGKKPEYLHRFLKPLLKNTHGLIVYQEQVIKICMKIGFSESEADEIRKVMGKKKPELLVDIEPKFIEKCRKTTGEEIAEQLWKQLCEYAAYCFNKSHSIGYATLSYATAYLKANYPLAFYTALLNHTSDPSGIQDIVNDMKPIQLLPPLSGKTGKEFRIEGDNIRYGLCGIYGIGNADGQKILDTGSKLLGKKSELTAMLIRAGYFDSINPHRKILLTSNHKGRSTRLALSIPEDFTPDQKDEYLFDLLHVYLSESPLKKYDYPVYSGNRYSSNIKILAIIKSITTKTSKAGNKYLIVETINVNNKIDRFLVVGKKYSEIELGKNKHYILTIDTLGDSYQITDAKRIGNEIYE